MTKKKLGRPPLPEGEKKPERMWIRLRSDQDALIRRAAELDEKTLAAWTRNVLVKAAKRRVAKG